MEPPRSGRSLSWRRRSSASSPALRVARLSGSRARHLLTISASPAPTFASSGARLAVARHGDPRPPPAVRGPRGAGGRGRRRPAARRPPGGRRPLTTASIAAACSGDIQPRVPPRESDTHCPAEDGTAGQVEVEEHGLPIDGNQHVRGLQVHVHEAPLMSEVEGLGQARGNPASRPRHETPRPGQPERPVRSRQGGGLVRVLVDQLDDEPSPSVATRARRPGPRTPGAASYLPGRACKARGGSAPGRSPSRRGGRYGYGEA